LASVYIWVCNRDRNADCYGDVDVDAGIGNVDPAPHDADVRADVRNKNVEVEGVHVRGHADADDPAVREEALEDAHGQDAREDVRG